MTHYDQLNAELRKSGVCNNDLFDKRLNPVEFLTNSKISSKPFTEILLKYLPLLNGNERDMVIRALTEKGNDKAVPYLLEIANNPKEKDELQLWTVCNALYIIDNTEIYNEILNICKEPRVGIARQMLLGILAKMRTKEAYQLLVELLNDSKLKGHVIEALGKFGDPKAIEILEKIQVEKGKYEFKAKVIAINRLNKKL